MSLAAASCTSWRDGPLSGNSAHAPTATVSTRARSEEHTSELQSRRDLVCRLLLEKKNYQSGRVDDGLLRPCAAVADHQLLLAVRRQHGELVARSSGAARDDAPPPLAAHRAAAAAP